MKSIIILFVDKKTCENDYSILTPAIKPNPHCVTTFDKTLSFHSRRTKISSYICSQGSLRISNINQSYNQDHDKIITSASIFNNYNVNNSSNIFVVGNWYSNIATIINNNIDICRNFAGWLLKLNLIIEKRYTIVDSRVIYQIDSYHILYDSIYNHSNVHSTFISLFRIKNKFDQNLKRGPIGSSCNLSQSLLSLF